MSKKGGLGSKRIGSMTSKGMGKCSAGSKAEQCGNGIGLGSGKLENMEKIKFHPGLDLPPLKTLDHLVNLQTQLSSLEVELKKVQEKISRLKGD